MAKIDAAVCMSCSGSTFRFDPPCKFTNAAAWAGLKLSECIIWSFGSGLFKVVVSHAHATASNWAKHQTF